MCDTGAGRLGQWPFRTGECLDFAGRPSEFNLCEQTVGSPQQISQLRSACRSEMDHHCSGLSERTGCDKQQKGRTVRSSKDWGRCSESTAESKPKEERPRWKGPRKAEPEQRPRCRGGLVPDGLNADQKVPRSDPDNLFTASIDFWTWCISLPRWIAATKTKFSWALVQSFHAKRQGSALSTAVFPLPSPSLDKWTGSGPKLSRKRFKKLAFDRLLHVVIYVLDYLYLGRFPSHAEIGRPLNAAQLEVVDRLRSALTVCGESIGTVPMIPGRSGPELASRLMQLENFLIGCPEFVDAYSKLNFSSFKHDRDLLPESKFPQLVPHRSLDADRIRIVGEGKWPLSDYLDSTLWLPFQEPLFLHHSEPIDKAKIPSFKHEDRGECLKLARLWDSIGLLSLFKAPAKPDMFCRVFQVYKSAENDRQIGDRRLPNALEYHLPGPSRELPQGPMLTQIFVPRGTHLVRGSVTDRRDFYHQAEVSAERAQTNLLPFVFRSDELEGTVALAKFWEEKLARDKRRDRTLVGDRFGFSDAKNADASTEEFYCGFKSLFQGDHLGVEFALDSHQKLLTEGGLLQDHRRLLGGQVVPFSRQLEGLIIDDYFVLSIDPIDLPPDASFAMTALERARKIYADSGLLGSEEKDVVCQERFKAAGAEIDSGELARKHGLITVSAPRSKLLALSTLSLRIARLPTVTPKIAQRLTGNWVSVLLYRRCWSSIVSDLFALGCSFEDEFDSSQVLIDLPRKCAQELALLSVIAPLIFSNISVDLNTSFRASDSSSRKGAYTSVSLSKEEVADLWKQADKKGGYTNLRALFELF